MFSTRSLTTKMVHGLDVPACLSSTGSAEARYLAVNDGYLQLVERIWPELENKTLVSAGAVVSGSPRDRRRWLLQTQGFYDAETASIRTATGRLLTIKISAQRIWCSGEACDLEYLTPAPVLNVPSPTVGICETTQKAMFSPRVRRNLEAMRPLEGEILIRRMLTLTADGLAVAANLAQSPEVSIALEEIAERTRPYRIPSEISAQSFDFGRLSADDASDLLLQLAGEIWLVIVFCQDPQVSEMLRSLVEGYTVPKPVLMGAPALVGFRAAQLR